MEPTMQSRILQRKAKATVVETTVEAAAPPPPAKGIAARMGRWSATHRKLAVLIWIVFLVGAIGAGALHPMQTIDRRDAGSGESHRADAILNASFPEDQEGLGEFVLVQSDTATVDSPAFRSAIEDVEHRLAAFPQIQNLQSPLTGEHKGQISPDRHAVMVAFTPTGTYAEATGYIDDITTAVKAIQAKHPDFYIGNAGLSTDKALNTTINGGIARAGMIAVPLTIFILLVVLGSLTSAFVPVGLALSAVLASMGLTGLLSAIVPMDPQVNEVVLLVGLAVGVDYSLFYIRRERDERRAGRSATASLQAAAATSGRAVLVSGMTVMIAMAGMFLSGDKTFISFAVGTMAVVFVAMIGSLTVLPAILSKLGDRIELGRVPFLGRRRAAGEDGRVWGSIMRPVMRHPLVSAIAAAGALVALALPALQLHTATSGMDALPKSMPELQTFHALEKAFPGGASAASVAIKAPDTPATRAAIDELKTLAVASGEMQEPINLDQSPDGRVFRVDIPLAGKGTDAASNHALATLRDEVLPASIGKLTGAEYGVTGQTAASKDFVDGMKTTAPLVFAFVLGFAFLLLLVAFRSIVVAVKAILLNLLSVAAAYGVLVAIFQWGWGEDLLDFNSTGGIAAWLPMFLFVILFGLSMDYHVFILSRVREGYDRGLSTEQAVEQGIRKTAGVVTGAAMVMVAVFSVFAILPMLDLKEMGIGLAVAVLIDATLVRAVLLPASMKLLGDRNWYLPSWLGWLPRLEHESAPVAAPALQPIPA
jgi:RND superfamily putative drug exporter